MDKIKRHIYEYDEIVVGENLSAILYAYTNSLPLFFKSHRYPMFFEHFSIDFPLENIHFKKFIKSYKTTNGTLEVGPQKQYMYDRLLFTMSLAGLVPVSDKIETIRIEDDNLLKVTTENSRLIKVRFNKLRLFNPDVITGISDHFITTQSKYVVFDYIDLKHKTIQLIDNSKDEFVHQVWFNTNKRSIVLSFIDKKNIEDFDYSIVPVRYKTLELFKENKLNIKDFNIAKRDAYPEFEYQLKKEIKNVIFDPRKEEEICQSLAERKCQFSLGVYHWRLNHYLLDFPGEIL